MDERPEQAELGRKLERVESLVAALEKCPDPEVRATTQELVGTLMDFHGDAIGRIMAILQENAETGAMLLPKMAEDPLVQGVLLLYGLHPLDVEARVQQALEKVRPSLKSHRGDVELLSLDADSVRLRLIGTCNGCPSSATTFRNLLEGAIQELAPEINSIQVEGMIEPGRAAG